RRHLELAASLYRAEEHREFAFRYGQDIGASALCYLSWALWHDGYPDQAARTADRALLLAREFATLTRSGILSFTSHSPLFSSPISGGSSGWRTRTRRSPRNAASHCIARAPTCSSAGQRRTRDKAPTASIGCAAVSPR